MNRASIMALLDIVLLRSWRIGADPIVASTALTADQLGHVVVDATAGAVAVTLPSASAALGGVEVTLRRKDVTTNVLSIVAAGADKIVLPGDASGIAATELLFPGDYLTLRADGAGKWWCVGQAQLPASLASGLVVFAAAGVSTFTVPPVLRSGRRRPIVTVMGGGGGGARNSASPGPSGGGAGGVAEGGVDLTGIATVSVTIGLGGAGGAASGDNGAAGGTSSFGAFLSATGGVGGFANTVASGASGVGTGGAINYGLGHGGLPLQSAVSTIYGGSGGGASSVHSNSGGAPTSPGHGGGGRTTVPGHAGLSGQVEVRW